MTGSDSPTIARGSALLLDVMSTLVHDPFHIEVPAFLGMTLEQLLEAKHPTLWAEFERNEIDEGELFARFFRDGRAFDGPGMKQHMVQHYRFLPGIEDLLADLRSAGVAMHALSNYPDWYHEIEERTQLSRYVTWSFVSCDTGLRKPDPGAYLHAASTLGLAPELCLFVDDQERNVHAASALGMQALTFEGAAELRRELGARGLL